MSAATSLSALPASPGSLGAGLTIVADGANLPCGAIVFWQAKGETTVDAIADALTARKSHARRPDVVSTKVAAARACDTVAARHGLKIQPLSKRGIQTTGTRTRATAGIALSRPLAVRPDGNLGQLEGPVVAIYHAPHVATRTVSGKAKKDGSARRVQERYEVPASFEGEPDMVRELREELTKALQVLIPADVSTWLKDRVIALGGIAMTSHGGNYFLPPEAMPKYEVLRGAVQAVTETRLARIPCMKGEEAVDAVIMALEATTTDAINAINLQIASGELGKRAIETKEKELAGLLDRLVRYEGLLGTKLDSVRTKIEEAESAAACAMLAAGADEDLGAA